MTGMINAVDREYRDLSPLEIRIQTHQRYSEATHDIEADVIEQAAISTGDPLLDVGPGTGAFLARLAAAGHTAPLFALDFSAESAATCGLIPGVRAARGDAQHLPFAEDVFTVVTARHMLYHLDDPAAAITEARRVLRPGGRFTAAVNRESPYPHMLTLLRDVLTANGIPLLPPVDDKVHGGNLPDLVARGFDTGEPRVLRRDNALVFDDPEPVVRYLTSVFTLQGVPEDPALRQAITADLDAAARARFRTLPGGLWRDPKGYVLVTAVA